MKMKRQQPLSAILKTSRAIIVTPISYKAEELGRVDYEREMEHYIHGFGVMWDDAPSNDAREGDLFAFVSGQGRKETDAGEGYCQVRRVISVHPSAARPSYWQIPAHEDRHVLILSDIVYEGTWVGLSHACGKRGWGKVLNEGTPDEIRCMSPRQGSKRWKLTEV